jgi:hypothetical protein
VPLPRVPLMQGSSQKWGAALAMTGSEPMRQKPLPVKGVRSAAQFLGQRVQRGMRDLQTTSFTDLVIPSTISRSRVHSIPPIFSSSLSTYQKEFVSFALCLFSGA